MGIVVGVKFACHTQTQKLIYQARLSKRNFPEIGNYDGRIGN